MTPPRRVIPGQIHFASRRCTQRHFLLRPDTHVVQIYLYCLAEAAARFGVTLYGWVAMSNHHHVLFRDNHGNYPEFLEHLHKMIAKAMNAHLDRRENFWSSEQASVVAVVEGHDEFAKLMYVLMNPVNANLVDRVTDWPGATCLTQLLSGRAQRIKRPRGFFREHGPMPREVELRAERLDQFTSWQGDAFREAITTALTKSERLAREERRQAQKRVVGRKGVLNTAPEGRPTTPQPRRQERPLLACLNRKRRELELGVIRAFRALYRGALALWRDGDRAVRFPEGTYKMRWFGAHTEPIAGCTS